MSLVKIFCLSILLVSPRLFSQSKLVILSGNVSGFSSGTALAFASVFVEEVKKGTITGKRGEYAIELPSGSYTVTVSFVGYKSFQKKIILKENRILNIQLIENPIDLEEVIIKGNDDKNISDVTIGMKTLRVEDIKTLPAFLGQSDIVKSLLLLPGVSSIGEGASGFNVRGGKVGQNLVLYNGAPLFNSSHILGLFSSFNTDAVKSFDLYKGHIPARYGGRLSSVLNIKGREGDYYKYKFDASIGLLTGKIYVEGPISKGKTSFLISGRATYSDWILELAKNPDIKNSKVDFYDINTNISHNFNSNNKLSINYYLSKDKFQFAQDFGFKWDTSLVNAEWNTSLNSKLKLNLITAYSKYKSTSFDPEGIDAFTLDTGIEYFLAKGNLSYALSDRYTLKAGTEAITYHGMPEQLKRINDDQILSTETVNKEHAQEIVAYFENDISLFPWLTASFGIRYTRFRNFGPYTVFEYQKNSPILKQNIISSKHYSKGETIQRYSDLEPRASVRIQLKKENSIKFSYNQTRQYIHSITNSASPTPADLWQFSNRYIKPQSSENFSLGYFHNFNNNQIETSVEVFHKNIDNQVEYRDFAQIFMNDHLETELISGKGRAYGIEFLLNKKAGNWTGWFSYAYVRSFITVNNTIVEERINNGNEFPSNFDQPHKLNIALKRKLGRKSVFSTSFTYITGRPITAISSSYQAGGTVIPIYTKRNGERIPEFIRLDMSFTVAESIWSNRPVSKNKKVKQSVTFSFYNVLNRRNAFSVFYQRVDNRDILVAKKLSVIGSIIPSVTYNISF